MKKTQELARVDVEDMEVVDEQKTSSSSAQRDERANRIEKRELNAATEVFSAIDVLVRRFDMKDSHILVLNDTKHAVVRYLGEKGCGASSCDDTEECEKIAGKTQLSAPAPRIRGLLQHRHR